MIDKITDISSDISADTILADCRFAFVDVETTGSSPALGDRVVEIGLVRVEQGKAVYTQQQLLNPGRSMTSGASRVTGITSPMLVGQPLFADVWPMFQSQIRGCVLVGHNVIFDMGFLDRECRGLHTTLQDELAAPAVLDTCKLARRTFGRGGNGLQRLAERFGINKPGAHRALADCLTTAALFEILIEPFGSWNATLGTILTRQGGTVAWPTETNQTGHLQVSRSRSFQRAGAVAEDVADRLIAGRMVRIVYVDAKANQTDRTITPRYVRRFAHCHDRGADRQFIVEQILSVSPE
jgi:DNA polymerase III epsilon subunit family exonuclease